MYNPVVSVVVPTKNSAKNLADLLESIKQQTYSNIEVIINDDKNTSDQTGELINHYKNMEVNIFYLQQNTSMAQARKLGAEYAKGDILIHLDSDMRLSPGLVEECVALTNKGFDALVMPEESFGIGFWAQCKWLEKKCYVGVEQIESLRCLKTSVYKESGGHNPALVFSEDKDLDIRVRGGKYKVGRTTNKIFHNEGYISLSQTIKKKLSYSKTASQFARLHPKEFEWQTNIFNRYLIYIKNIDYLFSHPIVYFGLFVMKTCEFGAGGIGILKTNL